MASVVYRSNTPDMTRSARVDRALRTTGAETSGSSRRSRRMGNDPFILLAVALAIPTVVVNYLDRGPDEVAISLGAVVFIALQAVLSVVWPSGGRNPSRNPLPRATWRVPLNDLRALVRLTLALAFVGAATYATADVSSVPLAPLFLPVIGLAATIGAGEAVVILVLAGLAYLAAFQYNPVLVASATEQALVLAAVSVVLVIGTRQTVSSLNAALARLRTVNASERRRNRQMMGLDAVGRTLAADGPEPSSLQAVWTS